MSKAIELIPTSPFWAILPDALETIKAAHTQYQKGEFDASNIQARIDAQRKAQGGFQRADKIAIINLDGVLSRYLNLFSILFGGTSTAQVEQDFRAAIEDPTVSGILLLINSPGGSVDGSVELASAIYAARGTKPITALIDGTGASAAYWVASSADKVLMRSPTGVTGSIGVIASHFDFSQREKQSGLTVTEIASAPSKNILSSHAPLSPEGRAEIERQVGFLHSQFVSDMTRNRGKSAQAWATGAIFFGQEAVSNGLADGFASVDDVIAELSGNSPQGAKAKAASVPTATAPCYQAVNAKPAPPVITPVTKPMPAPDPELETDTSELASAGQYVQRVLCRAKVDVTISEAIQIAKARHGKTLPPPEIVGRLAVLYSQESKEQRPWKHVTLTQAVEHVTKQFGPGASRVVQN
jgi:signal peptide peptidase SppA